MLNNNNITGFIVLYSGKKIIKNDIYNIVHDLSFN